MYVCVYIYIYIYETTCVLSRDLFKIRLLALLGLNYCLCTECVQVKNVPQHGAEEYIWAQQGEVHREVGATA